MFARASSIVIPGEPKAREGDPDLSAMIVWILFPGLAGDDGGGRSTLHEKARFPSPASGRVAAKPPGGVRPRRDGRVPRARSDRPRPHPRAAARPAARP